MRLKTYKGRFLRENVKARAEKHLYLRWKVLEDRNPFLYLVPQKLGLLDILNRDSPRSRISALKGVEFVFHEEKVEVNFYFGIFARLIFGLLTLLLSLSAYLRISFTVPAAVFYLGAMGFAYLRIKDEVLEDVEKILS